MIKKIISIILCLLIILSIFIIPCSAINNSFSDSDPQYSTLSSSANLAEIFYIDGTSNKIYMPTQRSLAYSIYFNDISGGAFQFRVATNNYYNLSIYSISNGKSNLLLNHSSSSSETFLFGPCPNTLCDKAISHIVLLSNVGLYQYCVNLPVNIVDKDNPVLTTKPFISDTTTIKDISVSTSVSTSVSDVTTNNNSTSSIDNSVNSSNIVNSIKDLKLIVVMFGFLFIAFSFIRKKGMTINV